MQRERGYLGVLLVRAREVAGLAVEDVGVERSARRLGRTSWLARPGLVIHAGCMPELAADSSEYTVLLRSRSGARVRRGYYMDVTDFPDGLGGQVHVRISTRWEDLGLDYPLPRELWMAVRARADSVDAAVSSAANVSSVLAMIISFCVNAVVEPPALHVVFNSTAGLSRREFMEVFVPDETGLPRIGRGGSTWRAHSRSARQRLRVLRRRGSFALLPSTRPPCRYWNTGSRVLVLAHLYIACEVLDQGGPAGEPGASWADRARARAATRGGHQPEEVADDGRELRTAGIHLRGRQADLRHCPARPATTSSMASRTSAASGRLPMM